MTTRPAVLPAGQAWPDADALFRGDPCWRGADNAYSVPLGGDRTLWLFADSFVADPPGPRSQATEVWGNTIAIMTGLDPSSASIRFFWRDGPTAVFAAEPREGADRLVMWPGHGIRLQTGLLLFFQVISFDFPPGADQPASFTFVGWAARMVSNPDDEPSRWAIRALSAPQNPFGIIVGSAQVLVDEDHLYAYSANPTEPIDAFLARWRRERVERGDLDDPEWWCGGEDGWGLQSSLTTPPTPVLRDAKTEFTVHAGAAGEYVQVQGSDYLDARMLWRRAAALEGPWSAPEPVYDPPELARPEDIALYAFKAHPHLVGADLVATYVALPMTDRDLLRRDEELYSPRFVRLSFER